jgi:hypothetical protein
MPKHEHLDDVIERLQLTIANSSINCDHIVASVKDVERLINASIWGDE